MCSSLGDSRHHYPALPRASSINQDVHVDLPVVERVCHKVSMVAASRTFFAHIKPYHAFTRQRKCQAQRREGGPDGTRELSSIVCLLPYFTLGLLASTTPFDVTRLVCLRFTVRVYGTGYALSVVGCLSRHSSARASPPDQRPSLRSRRGPFAAPPNHASLPPPRDRSPVR